MTKERPILFSGAMVRAILDGQKTQTRRIMKNQPPADTFRMDTFHHPKGQHYFWAYKEAFSGCELHPGWEPICCPYGQPGDRLWVREAWAEIRPPFSPWPATMYVYRAGDTRTDYGGPWKPSIHMPRKACRIELEITSVRVERLNDCSEADAVAEGVIQHDEKRGWVNECKLSDGKRHFDSSAYGMYRQLWEDINGADSWDANPWVWVVEFRKV
ncbi:hypothetical protein [Ralstonia pickettii]|uniref:hypothetical protein n=1 Tax=Ralstonia pickettii TaxID=329 RepID=UPI0015F9B89D|nr:hypothetical protein [Ralstonia pickettii]MBB0025134.1 hypothetical protein [Ralstonia pickettii]MBB0034723.1 hypothetical protein [Ralstonia pickettii]MBB0098279.1 hypothetical protein [Ralstonia pickettii]MBB0108075.1 hypothetical protein [Ralstonia pickettii]MBB0129236.1 hypothetical protein [Ralstonia pickettii]